MPAESSQLLSSGQIAAFIIGSIVVIFAAYAVTYWVATSSRRLNKGRMIHVLDRFSLSKDKSILVIEIFDQIYVVAFSNGAITLLDKPDLETVRAFSPTLEESLAQVTEGGFFTRFRASFVAQLKAMFGRGKQAYPPKASFESYLQQEQPAEEDDLDRVYNRMQNRRDKNGGEQQDSFEEDTRS